MNRRGLGEGLQERAHRMVGSSYYSLLLQPVLFKKNQTATEPQTWQRSPQLRGAWLAHEHKSIFEIMGKFQSHDQNRAQRLHYVILRQIIT